VKAAGCPFVLQRGAEGLRRVLDAQQKLGINRGATGLAVAVSQSLAHKLKTDVLLDQPQQMILRNLIF
jgi:hypothetical protein